VGFTDCKGKWNHHQLLHPILTTVVAVFISLDSFGCEGRNSGKKKYIPIKFKRDKTAANSGGKCMLWDWVKMSAPNAGPKMNASPNAAPIKPNPLARSSGPVMSAMQAWAREMLPPNNPSNMRLANNIINDWAPYIIRKLSSVAHTQTNNNLFLPYTSDNLPIHGAVSNCASALAVSNKPTVDEEEWNSME